MHPGRAMHPTRTFAVLVALAAALVVATGSGAAGPPAPATTAPRHLVAHLALLGPAPAPVSGGVALRPSAVFAAVLTPAPGGALVRWRLTSTNITARRHSAFVYLGTPGVPGPVVTQLCTRCRLKASGTSFVPQPFLAPVLAGGAYVALDHEVQPNKVIAGVLRVVKG